MLIALLPLVACDGDRLNIVADELDRGEVLVCLDGGRPIGEDEDVELGGIVTAVNEGLGDCTQSVTLQNADGDSTTVGIKVLAKDGSDVTPDTNVVVGNELDLVYRYRMVWGDVAGFVLSDSSGPVFAAEEGTWGGALETGDVVGLSVALGEWVATEETDCEPMEGHSMVFSADDTVQVTPLGAASLNVGGRRMLATGVAAWDWGEGDGCDVSDSTGRTAWVVGW